MPIRPFCVIVAVLSAPMVVCAKDPVIPVPTQLRVGFDRIRQSDLRADLAFISSAALLGRMSLQPGDDSAAEWVAAEFAKAGLEPAATDASGPARYLQAVPLIQFRSDREASFLALERDGQTRRWGAPEVFGGFHDAVEVSAPLAFAGYGITAPGLGYDDYMGLDAKGKIVLVFEHEPQETDSHSRFNGTGNTRHATNRVKALNAQAHGAVAMLIVAEPNRKHPSNQERIARVGNDVGRLLALPSQVLANDELHIPMATVSDAIGAELLGAGEVAPQELQAAIDKDLSIQSRILRGARVTLHFENKERTTGVSYNVVGLLRGRDPKLSTETILVGAHHDHNGWSPSFNGQSQIWHGADDNGSGTIGVVALAQAFAANPLKPKRSLLFVVFAAEERGSLGAYYMSAHPLRPLDTTRAMINFDQIGRDEAPSDQTNGLIEIPKITTNRLNLIGGAFSPDLRRTVAAANRIIGLDLDDRFDEEHALNVLFRGDHFPFLLRDIPALWFFTGFHPDYHHTTDTTDKIDYAKMTRILQLAFLSAWRLSDDAAVPKFVSDPPGN